MRDNGKGKLADIDFIEERIESLLQEENLLKGKKVLVTAGPTQEALDPVRFITNHSSGRWAMKLPELPEIWAQMLH